MNIFVTDPCPYNSAKYLDNKRVIKMILETAQMLSTAIIVSGGSAPYKPTHQNHPCSVWARTTLNNYLWLIEHFKALNAEYTKAYGKVHKSYQYLERFVSEAYRLPEGPLTSFPNCTIYKEEPNVHSAYKKYLQYKWDNDKLEPKFRRK